MNDAERQRLISDTRALLAGLESVSEGITAARWKARHDASAQAGDRPPVAFGKAPRPHGHHGGGDPDAGRPGYSDPSGLAVASTADRAARVEVEVRQWDDDLVTASDLIAAVATRVAVVLRPPKDPRPTQRERRVCESCARAGLKVDIWVDRYKEWCRFCGDYKGAEGRRPPVAACVWKERHGKNPRADQIARWLHEERSGGAGGR